MSKIKTKQIDNFVLDSLTDVDNTTSVVGDVIRYDGIEWIKYDQKDGMLEVYSSININLSTGSNPTTWTNLTWNTQVSVGSIYTHSTVTNSQNITITEDGYYEFEYSITIDNTSSSSRSSAEIRVSIDTGLGFNPIARTTSYTYNRSFTNGLDTKTKRFGFEIATGDIIKIEARKISGNNNTQLTMVADASSFLIRRIR